MSEKIGPHTQAWVNALRSGKYSQGQGSLRHNDTYCCLGVLCNEFRDHTGNGEWQETTAYPGTRYAFALGDDTSATVFPPGIVWEWVGADDFESRNSVNLATHNDNGAPFEEIAKLIEANPATFPK